jgi:hypothetical protein
VADEIPDRANVIAQDLFQFACALLWYRRLLVPEAAFS